MKEYTITVETPADDPTQWPPHYTSYVVWAQTVDDALEKVSALTTYNARLTHLAEKED